MAGSTEMGGEEAEMLGYRAGKGQRTAGQAGRELKIQESGGDYR